MKRLGLLAAGLLLTTVALAQNTSFLTKGPIAYLTDEDEALLRAAFDEALDGKAHPELVKPRHGDIGGPLSQQISGDLEDHVLRIDTGRLELSGKDPYDADIENVIRAHCQMKAHACRLHMESMHCGQVADGLRDHPPARVGGQRWVRDAIQHLDQRDRSPELVGHGQDRPFVGPETVARPPVAEVEELGLRHPRLSGHAPVLPPLVVGLVEHGGAHDHQLANGPR